MKHKRLMALVAACATMAIVTFIPSREVHGQSASESRNESASESRNESTNESATQSAAVPIYNPYPQGILPSNIDSEIQRVRREENSVEREATNEWLALTPPTVTGDPPMDPLEMGMPDTACIVFRLSRARYRPLFEQVWGAGSFDISWPANTAQICSTPNGASQFGGSATPVHLSPEDRTRSNTVYNEWGLSIDAFEQSVAVSAFSSKFDAFLAGKYTMTADEMAGYTLFRGKGNCNSCHLDGRLTASPGTEDTGTAASTTPLFTCFGSANIGLPKNPSVAFYSETTPDGVGLTPNPEGFAFTDNGLGTFLRSGFGSAPNPNATWRQFAAASDGKMQTSTARNVALTPRKCPTTEAPGPYFQKEFFHNGYMMAGAWNASMRPAIAFR
jgi:cytochrome c peroxidase